MISKLRTVNLKFWLPFITSMLLLSIASLQVYVSYKQELREIEASGMARSESILFQLSHFISYALANNRPTEAKSIVASAPLLDGVETAVVINDNYQVIYASKLAWIGGDIRQLLQADHMNLIQWFQPGKGLTIEKNKHHIHATTPLIDNLAANNTHAHYLYIEYDLTPQLQRATQHVIHDTVPIISISLISAFVLMLVVHQLVSKPLTLLRRLTARIKTHQDTIDNPLVGDNELAQVGQALSDAGYKIRDDIRQLSDRENRLSITLKAIADGVIVTNNSGEIQLINPTAEQLIGVRAADAINQPVNAIFKVSSVADGELIDPIADALQSGETFEQHNHAMLHASSGKTYQIFQTAAPIYDDKNLVGVVLVFQDVSQEYLLRNQLKSSVAFLENLLHVSPSITFVLKPDTNGQFNFTYISQSIERFTGAIPDMWLADRRLWRERIPDTDAEMLKQTIQQALDKQGEMVSVEFRLEMEARTFLNFQTNIVATYDDTGHIQIVGVAIDITEQTQTAEENIFLGKVLERSLSEIYIFDGNSLKYINVNYGGRSNLGYSMNELDALSPTDVQHIDPHDFVQLLQPLRSGEKKIIEYEAVYYRKDGSHYPVNVAIELDKSLDKEVFIAMVDDLTERKASEARINFLAYHDVLTELPNRVMLEEQLVQALSLSQRKREQFALLYLDLDRFKIINDTLGHAIGDELLVEVARRIQRQIRREDTVSRTGGDEFTIILLDTDSNGAAHVAQKILDIVCQPYRIGQHTLHVTVSIGISMFPENGDSATVLKQKADNAMYRAKETRHNCYQFFTEEMHDQMLHRMYLESQLHLAINNQELSLVYQPQLNIQHNEVVGAEALLRWHHPELGMIPPSVFIPIAEECGLINDIGRWVLDNACAEAERIKQQLSTPFIMAINLSGAQFRNAHLTDDIVELLSKHQLQSADIELEITESIAMQDLTHTIPQMNRLSDAGINLSLDDFGTGFSSLNSLKKFPIHRLKIDKSFIDDMLIDSDDEAIVEAIITLADTLDLLTIAEGVETQKQLEVLRDKGCECMQGYLFSKPVPADELLQLIQQSQKPT